MRSRPNNAPTLRLVNTDVDRSDRVSRPGDADSERVIARFPKRDPGARAVRSSVLRSVSDRPSTVGATPDQIGLAEAEIARANAEASRLTSVDPRWVLAVRAAHSLEGGRAAILRPEKRRSLVEEGKRLGLRPFDANLVIAIVQDGARAGEGVLGPGVAGRVSLVRKAEPEAPSRAVEASTWAMLGMSGALAGALTLIVIAWLLTG